MRSSDRESPPARSCQTKSYFGSGGPRFGRRRGLIAAAAAAACRRPAADDARQAEFRIMSGPTKRHHRYRPHVVDSRRCECLFVTLTLALLLIAPNDVGDGPGMREQHAIGRYSGRRRKWRVRHAPLAKKERRDEVFDGPQGYLVDRRPAPCCIPRSQVLAARRSGPQAMRR